jgi:hypothetical protein
VRSVRIARSGARASDLVGRVLSIDVAGEDGARAFGKGSVIAESDVERLLALAWHELHVVEMESGDVHEDIAGTRLAAAAAGPGVFAKAASGGHWPLVAKARGILDIATDALRDVNAIEGICVYTLWDGQVVGDGETIARAKITPFVIEASKLERATSLSGAAGGVVRVRPFQSRRIGAVVQESLGDRAMARFRDALGEKVAWFGSTLLEPELVPPKAEAIAAALERSIAGGAQILTIAGTKAMDALDPAFGALESLGGRIERHGVPAHPGSLFWLAYVGEVPVLGMPTCGLFSQATVFDLVVPRLLAGDHIDRHALADLGHGGFLTRDMAFRFPPYRATADRGEVE